MSDICGTFPGNYYLLDPEEFDEAIWDHSIPMDYYQAVRSPVTMADRGSSSYPDNRDTNADVVFEYPYAKVSTRVARLQVSRARARFMDFGEWEAGQMYILVPGQLPDDSMSCGWAPNRVWETIGYGDKIVFPDVLRRYTEEMCRGNKDSTALHLISDIYAIWDQVMRQEYILGTDFTLGTDQQTLLWLPGHGPQNSATYVMEFAGPAIAMVGDTYAGPERGGEELGRIAKRAPLVEFHAPPISNAIKDWRS